jgi:16S rRNA C1402 N4-methylase RsmH
MFRLTLAARRDTAGHKVLEHPPVMVRALVHAVFRGPRWDFTQKKAHFIAKWAVAEGEVAVSKAAAKLLDVARPKAKRALKGAKRGAAATGKKAAAPSDALVPVAASAVMPAPGAPVKRDVRFDVLDCTFGAGHHASAMLEYGAPYCRVVGLDCDHATERAAAKLTKLYGSRRFKHFTSRMADAVSLFGARGFDAVILDPGPRFEQLTDPARGFGVDDEDGSLLDLRYGPFMGSTALEVLNNATHAELLEHVAYYSSLPRRLCGRFVSSLARARPLRGSRDVMGHVTAACGGEAVPDDVWFATTEKRFVKASPSARLLIAIRAMVNDEYGELTKGLGGAFELLHAKGRCVVFTRAPWEHAAVAKFAEDHPFALVSHTEQIGREDAADFSQPLDTTMWVINKTPRSSFPVKNMALTDREVAVSAQRRLFGLDDRGPSKGYPAERFAFSTVRSAKEHRDAARNANPPLLDNDRAKPVPLRKRSG